MTSKVVLITGAGSGIGQSLALAFAKANYHVIATDIHQETASITAALIKEHQGQATAMAMDVTQEEQVKQVFAEVKQQLGRLDCLISNAGIQIIKPIDQLDFTSWQKMMSIHLDGAFLCTRAALNIMYPQNSGSIIYMGSIHSKIASALKAPYVTAKHGLLGLCRTVAKEAAQYNIAANVICPGFVRTPLVDKQIPEQAQTLGISEEDVVKKVMLGGTVDGEFTTEKEICETALFLADYPNLGLTGQSIMLTHGWLME